MLMYLYRVGTSSRILVNTVPCKAMTTYSGHKFYKVRLSWPNRSFGFFCNILWKKLSKHFGQPSIFMLECLYFIISNASRVSSEKAMAPHSSTLAWKIPWTEEPGRLQSMGSQESDMTEQLHFHFSLFYALEKEMATHSSVLAWRIPGMGSHRVGYY